MDRLLVEPLTRDAFRPYGEVLERDGAERRLINEGTTTRYHALGRVTVRGEAAGAIVSIFSGRPRARPLVVAMLERHPLGSQTFFPLEHSDWLVVVGEVCDGQRSGLRCFRARGDQGVSYAANVWHHPLLVLDAPQDFLVIDREGPDNNCEEFHFPENSVVIDLTI